MTKREIVFLACRLMALYLLMNSLFQLSQSLQNFFPFDSIATSGMGTQSMSVSFNGSRATVLQLVSFVVFKLSPVLLLWLGAFLLWFLARDISMRMFQNEPEELTQGPVFTVGDEARAIAFACLGGFFLMQDLPNAALWLIARVWDAVRWTQAGLPFGYGSSWLWIVRIPISLWLVFGLRGMAGLWRMAQEKGIAPTGASALVQEDKP